MVKRSWWKKSIKVFKWSYVGCFAVYFLCIFLKQKFHSAFTIISNLFNLTTLSSSWLSSSWIVCRPLDIFSLKNMFSLEKLFLTHWTSAICKEKKVINYSRLHWCLMGPGINGFVLPGASGYNLGTSWNIGNEFWKFVLTFNLKHWYK